MESVHSEHPRESVFGDNTPLSSNFPAVHPSSSNIQTLNDFGFGHSFESIDSHYGGHQVAATESNSTRPG